MRSFLCKHLMLSLFTLLCACAQTNQLTHPHPSGSGQLDITVTGFRNDTGEALIYLYKSAEGFPDIDAPGLISLKRKIQQGRLLISLKHLPYGYYAISALHDENQDGQMNKSLLGFPREGFGFSRNPDLHYGPPAFSDVRFLFISDGQHQTIEMQYQTLRKNQPKRIGPKPGPG